MEEERWEEKSASFTKTVSNLYIEIKYCGDHSACPKKKKYLLRTKILWTQLIFFLYHEY